MQFGLFGSGEFDSSEGFHDFIEYNVEAEALGFHGTFVYLLSRALPRKWMPAAIGAAVTIVMLVGASRLFLYLHYFSDVLAGYAAGLAWLAVCIAMTELGLRRAR